MDAQIRKGSFRRCLNHSGTSRKTWLLNDSTFTPYRCWFVYLKRL